MGVRGDFYKGDDGKYHRTFTKNNILEYTPELLELEDDEYFSVDFVYFVQNVGLIVTLTNYFGVHINNGGTKKFMVTFDTEGGSSKEAIEIN